MRRTVLVLAGLAGLFALAFIAAFAWGRLRGPGPVRARAMALLQQDLEPDTGHNAWPALWLIDYAVPADRVDAVYARDVKRLRARLQAGAKSPHDPFTTSAEGNFARLPPIDPEARTLLCRLDRGHCLEHAQRHAPALRRLLAGQQARLARYRALHNDRMLWNLMPASAGTPLPPFQPLQRTWLSATALAFLDGHETRAVASVCTNARMVRRLHAHTNSLIAAMVTANWMAADERLLAAMLGHLPAGSPLPASCRQAYAPVTVSDIDLCAPMQRVHHGMSRGVLEAVEQDTSPRIWLYLDRDKGIRYLIAPFYAWGCRDATHERMLDDMKMDEYDLPATHPDFFDRLSNHMATIWASAATTGTNMADCMNHDEDYAAGLRLMALILRRYRDATPGGDRDGLERQLRQLRGKGTRSFNVTADGQHVRMTLYGRHPGREALVLALP